MTHLAKILPVANVALDLEVSSKKRAFEQAGLIFENNFGIARSIVSDGSAWVQPDSDTVWPSRTGASRA